MLYGQLRADISAAGDVEGPGSATEDNFASFADTSGKVIEDSGFAAADFLQVANDLSDLNDAPTARTNLGLGTIATQDADDVAITGGSVTGITDLAVADGGSGRSSATAYAVICGGTSSTDPHQSVASEGTAGQVLTSNGANTLPTFQDAASGGVGSNSEVNIFEDFMLSPLASTFQTWFGYVTSGTGTAVGSLDLASPSATNPGVWQLETGTTSSGYAFLIGPRILLGGGAISCEWLIRIPDLSTGTQRYILYIGLGDTIISGEPTSGCYFLYSDNVNSGNWQGKTASAASRSTANSSTAVTEDAWTKLRIDINAAATSVSFFVNGSEIANSPLSTNIPTGASIFPHAHIVKTVGSTERTLWVDYMSLTETLTTPR